MILDSIFFQFATLIFAFAILFKSADLFVDSAVGISNDFGIPRIVVGIIIVGFATTAPEITVSIISAAKGKSEFALGNALGSVIVDDGIALGLAALLSPVVIMIDKRTLKTTGIFLISVILLGYLLGFNGIFGRIEGVVFVLLLFAYWFAMVLGERRRRKQGIDITQDFPEISGYDKKPLHKHIIQLLIGLAGVVGASHLVVWSAEKIAIYFHVPEVIIGLTIIAIGTSLPEISTAIIAARKGEGEISVGNILGADILNILWIIGVSSMVNPIDVRADKVHIALLGHDFGVTGSIHFSFVWVILIVAAMLIFMRTGYRLRKQEGIALICMYLVYLLMNYSIFA